MVLATTLVTPRAYASDESRLHVQFNEGIVSFLDGEYPAALAAFTTLVDNTTTVDDTGLAALRTAALYWKGLCHLQMNDYPSASTAFDTVIADKPELMEVKLDAAIALIGRKEFVLSRDPLEAFIGSGTGGEGVQRMAHFFLGVVEYKEGRFAQATAALDVAEDGMEDAAMLASIEYWRGWIDVEQGRLQQASERFKRCSALSPQPDLKSRASLLAEEVLLDDFEDVELRSTDFVFHLDLGFNYDSNVILLGEDTSLPLDLSTDDDFRFGLGTDFTLGHWVSDDLRVGVGGNTFNSWHGSLGEFNVQTYGGRLFANYFIGDTLTLGLQYEYNYTLVENNAFLDLHRVTPSIRLTEAYHPDKTPLTDTTLFYVYEPRDYHEEVFDRRTERDGDYHTVGIEQAFNVHQPWIASGDERWMRFAVGYRWQEDSTTGDDFDRTVHAVTARVRMPLPHEFGLEFFGQWSWEDYWQENSQDRRRRKRNDFEQRYVVALSRNFVIDSHIDMTVSGEIAWTQDDSNLRNARGEAIYSYDRVIYGVTLSFAFR